MTAFGMYVEGLHKRLDEFAPEVGRPLEEVQNIFAGRIIQVENPAFADQPHLPLVEVVEMGVIEDVWRQYLLYQARQKAPGGDEPPRQVPSPIPVAPQNPEDGGSGQARASGSENNDLGVIPAAESSSDAPQGPQAVEKDSEVVGQVELPGFEVGLRDSETALGSPEELLEEFRAEWKFLNDLHSTQLMVADRIRYAAISNAEADQEAIRIALEQKHNTVIEDLDRGFAEQRRELKIRHSEQRRLTIESYQNMGLDI